MANTPPGCASALAALDVLVEEKLSGRANYLGGLLLDKLRSFHLPHVIDYSGSGLFTAVVVEQKPPMVTGRRIAVLLAQRGALVSANVIGNRIRFCPPFDHQRRGSPEGRGYSSHGFQRHRRHGRDPRRSSCLAVFYSDFLVEGFRILKWKGASAFPIRCSFQLN